VRDEHDRRAGLLPDAQDLRVHPLARHLVERPEWLVHEQDRGFERERPRDGDALLHPARQLVGMVAAEVAELDEVQHSLRALVPIGPAHPEQLERQLHVLLDGAPLEEDGCLEHHAVLAAEASLRRGLAIDLDAPGARPGQVADEPQQRALAAARWTDEAHELAAPDLEVDRLEGGRRPAPG
jgi:hypothetical protein